MTSTAQVIAFLTPSETFQRKSQIKQRNLTRFIWRCLSRLEGRKVERQNVKRTKVWKIDFRLCFFWFSIFYPIDLLSSIRPSIKIIRNVLMHRAAIFCQIDRLSNCIEVHEHPQVFRASIISLPQNVQFPSNCFAGKPKIYPTNRALT